MMKTKFKRECEMGRLERWWFWHSTDVLVYGIMTLMAVDVVVAIIIIILYG